MSEWLQTYNEMFGMYHAGIITTIFGAFAVTFTVLMSWPKLVKDFGPIGGFMAAALSSERSGWSIINCPDSASLPDC